MQNLKNLTKNLMHRKMNMKIMQLTVMRFFFITALSMSSDEAWYVESSASMHHFHIKD